MNNRPVITSATCMTPVGLDALSTVAAVRAGISGVRVSEQFDDVFGEPILEGCIPWLPHDEAPAEPEEPEPEAEIELDSASEEVDEAFDDQPALEEPSEDEEEDVYELARQSDDVGRITGAARECLSGLLDAYRSDRRPVPRIDSVFLGAAPFERPGLQFEGGDLGGALTALIRQNTGTPNVTVIRSGNPAAIDGVRRATDRLAQDPGSLHVVGALDSLISLETLNWLEEAQRLKSASFGRHHGIAPAEAVGFLMIETAASALRAGRPILAEIMGVGLAAEPNPFLSDGPSRGQGLTEACLAALDDAGMTAGDVGTVLCDLDGEFHRAKEWAVAGIRCFGGASPELLHPADCFGTIGAASSAVLIDIAAIGFSRGWFTSPVLVFCSDDAGACAAAVLAPASS